MFVAIDNTVLNVHNIDEQIKRERDANEGIISPEFAMEVLSKTNNFANIKKVLKTIKDTKTNKEDLLPYSEFILSCVDGREMSNVALDYLCSLADICEIRDKLETINEKPKVYSSKDDKGRVVYDKWGMKTVLSDNIPIFIDLSKENNARDRVWFRDDDFSNVVGIKGDEGIELNFSRVKNIRKNLTIDGVGMVKITFCEWEDRSGRLDLIGCRSFSLSSTDKVPENIDVSSCKVVNFYAVDMGKFDTIKFGDDVDLTFKDCVNMPEKLDLSFASDVGFVAVDLSKVKELKFRDGANVEFCSQIFAGRDVDTILPEYMDFSNCGEVKIQGETTALKQVKFKNREQGGEWAQTYESFYRGEHKVVYADDEKAKNNIRPANGGMEM